MTTQDKLETENAALRAAVEARLAAASISEAAGYGACCDGGRLKPACLPADIPTTYREANAGFTFVPATPQPPAKFETTVVGATMSPQQLDAAWAACKSKVEAMQERIKRVQFRCIGITGRAGSGKTTTASMIPGAVTVSLADPIYAGLAAMFQVPEAVLRSRPIKENNLRPLTVTVRRLLQTLGTEWGRNTIHSDVWVSLMLDRVRALREQGVSTVVVPDVRFENEAAAIRCMDGGDIWHVYRDDTAADDHSSEAGIEVGEEDAILRNTGTLDELRERVLGLLADSPRQ